MVYPGGVRCLWAGIDRLRVDGRAARVPSPAQQFLSPDPCRTTDVLGAYHRRSRAVHRGKTGLGRQSDPGRGSGSREKRLHEIQRCPISGWRRSLASRGTAGDREPTPGQLPESYLTTYVGLARVESPAYARCWRGYERIGFSFNLRATLQKKASLRKYRLLFCPTARLAHSAARSRRRPGFPRQTSRT